MNRLALFAAALGTGLLLFLAMAFPNLGFLSFVAFLPLFWMLENTPDPRLSFFGGWFGGSVFFVLLLYWLAIPVWDFGGAYRHLGIFGLLILFIIMGLFWGLFSYLANLGLRTIPVSFILFTPALWTIIEFIRIKLISPLPLGVVGYSLAPYPSLIQSAGIFGVLGISFFVLLINACLWVIFRGDMVRYPAIIILIVALAGNLGYGYLNLQKEQEKIMEVGLVQPNISQEEKWDYQRREANLEAHLGPSRALEEDVDLVVWPETSIPATPIGSQAEWGVVQDRLYFLEVPLLAGILSPQNARVHNTSLLLLQGEIRGYYHKKWLVPFGEYIPLQGLLGWVDTGFFPTTPGEEIKTFEYEGWSWATPICYEILNPGLIRRMSSNTDILFNQSNEAWFKDSIGLPILWSVGILRAVEVRRPLVKAANTGYSGWVDDLGRTRVLFPALEHYYDSMTIEATGEDSVYLRFGDFPIWPLFILSFVLSFLLGPMRKKKIDFKKYAER